MKNDLYSLPPVDLLSKHEEKDFAIENLQRPIISLHSLIVSEQFQKNSYSLPIAFGIDTRNQPVICDLAKMANILISGTWGSGKTNVITAFILSQIFRRRPHELQFVLADAKMAGIVESFGQLRKEYLFAENKAVIHDVGEIVDTLLLLNTELDARLSLLIDHQCRNIAEYNRQCIKYLPYIVVIIDEYTDFLLTAEEHFEKPLVNIAQKGRAVGIHLIISTQGFYSKNVITPAIRANFPVTLTFAEKVGDCGNALLTWGDEITLIHCPYVSTEEVEAVLGFLSN